MSLCHHSFGLSSGRRARESPPGRDHRTRMRMRKLRRTDSKKILKIGVPMFRLIAQTLLVAALAAGPLAAQSPALPPVEPHHVYQGTSVGSLIIAPNRAGTLLWAGRAYTLMLDSLGVEVWVDSAYAGILRYPHDFVDADVAARKTPEHPPIFAAEKLTVVFVTILPGPRAVVGIVFLPEESR